MLTIIHYNGDNVIRFLGKKGGYSYFYKDGETLEFIFMGYRVHLFVKRYIINVQNKNIFV